MLNKFLSKIGVNLTTLHAKVRKENLNYLRDYFSSIKNKKVPFDNLLRLKLNLKWTGLATRFQIIDMLLTHMSNQAAVLPTPFRDTDCNKDTAFTRLK